MFIHIIRPNRRRSNVPQPHRGPLPVKERPEESVNVGFGHPASDQEPPVQLVGRSGSPVKRFERTRYVARAELEPRDPYRSREDSRAFTVEVGFKDAYEAHPSRTPLLLRTPGSRTVYLRT